MITKFDETEMTAEFTIASTAPYRRADFEGEFDEVLVINPDAVNLERLRNGASVLFDHDSSKIVGATEDAWITDDGKLAVKARFRSADETSVNLFKDIKGGTVRNVSVGYTVESMRFEMGDSGRIGYVERWTPYETSIVGIPADETVGFYRSFDTNNSTVRTLTQTEEKKTMTDAEKKELERLKELEAAEAAEATEAEAETAAVAEEETAEEAKVEEAERSMKTANQRSFARIESVREYAPRFNIANALRSLIDPVNFKANKERKLSDELYRSAGLNSDGTRFMFRDFTSLGNNANALGLVETNYRGDLFTEALRSKMAVKGATWITDLKGITQFGAQTAEVAASWYGNVNTALTSSDPTVALITLSPKKLGATVTVKRDTIISGNNDAIGLVINDLISAIDRQLDATILTGNVTASINGVAGTTGVNSVTLGTSVGASTWQQFLGFGAAVGNYELNGAPSFIMGSADRQTLKGISKDAGSGRYICEENMIDGYNVDICGRLTTGQIYFGDWSQVLVGSWGGLEIFINPYKYGNGTIEIEGTIIADIAIRQPGAFAVGKLTQSSQS